MKTSTKEPVAVLISDVHYSRTTWKLADMAVRTAIDKAAELGVELIDCGDLTNDKSLLHAEYVNALIDTMKYAQQREVSVVCLVGNHSLLNTKDTAHALEFLRPYASVVDKPTVVNEFVCLPYYDDLSALQSALLAIPKKSTVIMHQGITNANCGHYGTDPNAAPTDWFANFRTISGHYHQRQTINCRNGRRAGKGHIGELDYVGNPYTLSFAEANEQKGFQVLYSDGALEFVRLNLRMHITLEANIDNLSKIIETTDLAPDTILKLTITGSRAELDTLNKTEIGQKLLGHDNYKLELVATNTNEMKSDPQQSPREVLNQLIDNLPESQDYKAYLQSLLTEIL